VEHSLPELKAQLEHDITEVSALLSAKEAVVRNAERERALVADHLEWLLARMRLITGEPPIDIEASEPLQSRPTPLVLAAAASNPSPTEQDTRKVPRRVNALPRLMNLLDQDPSRVWSVQEAMQATGLDYPNVQNNLRRAAERGQCLRPAPARYQSRHATMKHDLEAAM
jgi:hypothetical protein